MKALAPILVSCLIGLTACSKQSISVSPGDTVVYRDNRQTYECQVEDVGSNAIKLLYGDRDRITSDQPWKFTNGKSCYNSIEILSVSRQGPEASRTYAARFPIVGERILYENSREELHDAIVTNVGDKMVQFNGRWRGVNSTSWFMAESDIVIVCILPPAL